MPLNTQKLEELRPVSGSQNSVFFFKFQRHGPKSRKLSNEILAQLDCTSSVAKIRTYKPCRTLFRAKSPRQGVSVLDKDLTRG